MEVHGGELSVRAVNDEMRRADKQTKESEMPRDFIDFYLNKIDETTRLTPCHTDVNIQPIVGFMLSAQSKKSSSQQEIEVGFPTCHWKFQ